MNLIFKPIDKKPLKKILRYLKFIKKATKKMRVDTRRLKTNNAVVRHGRIIEQRVTEKFQQNYYIDLLIKNLVKILNHHQVDTDTFLSMHHIYSRERYLELLNDRIVNTSESKRWKNIKFYLRDLITKSRNPSFDYFVINENNLKRKLIGVKNVNNLLMSSFSVPKYNKKSPYHRMKKALKRAIKMA